MSNMIYTSNFEYVFVVCAFVSSGLSAPVPSRSLDLSDLQSSFDNLRSKIGKEGANFHSEFHFNVTQIETTIDSSGHTTSTKRSFSSHLAQFGYLPEATDISQILSGDIIANGIKEYQKFMGIPVTGKFDQATIQQMLKPRCGLQDKTPPGSKGSKFKHGGSRWSKRTLSYKIGKYSSKLQRDATDRTIRKALNMWSAVTPLRFVRKTDGPVHIEIRFETGDHGDDGAFDGRGNTLAHAYYPIVKRWGGDLHFDDAEHWTINDSRGTDLLQVAVHELGHSLGLDHSNNRDAIMYPSYGGYTSKLKLHDDDIRTVQRIYPE
ncbi:matrilysin-like [Macrosteles quadrilineatus]|uniref:matrilysin-like n=1 Tax=Macrosteles quadrilineatus TaxID=74068 RepID=UPI0023E09D59|nr:matrilysin-like [Macrosteles quadrilineatus]